MTCAEAAQAALSVSKNNEWYNSGALYSAQGYVTEIAYEWENGSMSFWMADTENGGKVIEAYKCAIENKDDAVRVGDLVKVTGKLTKYNTTPEFATGCTVEMIKRAEVLPVDTITVSQAVQRIKDGKLQACAIKGQVQDPFINTKAGNAVCYWMFDVENPKDSIQAFKMNGADNQKYSSLNDLEFIAGDVILVHANALMLYNNTINEINGGHFVKKISGSEDVDLSLVNAAATAYRQTDHWTLEIAKKDSVVNLVFALDEVDAIVGTHPLLAGSNIALNGPELEIVSGSVVLNFKEILNDYNVYDIAFKVVADGKLYHFNHKLAVYALDENDEEFALEGDRFPKEGEIVTCAKARKYALSLPDKTEGDITFSVEGYITDIFSNNKSFWIDDEEGSVKTFEIYNFASFLPEGTTLEKGLKIRATGKAKRYGDTPEMENAQVEVIPEGSGVEDITVNVNNAKFIYEGQLYILRDNAIYNVQGQLVK